LEIHISRVNYGETSSS